METASRRQFLVRGGVLIGGLAGFGISSAPAIAGGRVGTGIALEEGRRRTFAGLADTVLSGEPHRLPAGAYEQATRDFAERYAAWDGDARRGADAILDALDRAEGRSFGRADAHRRATVLKEHATPTSAAPTGPERKRLDLAEAALGLLDTVIGPDTETDHSPTTV